MNDSSNEMSLFESIKGLDTERRNPRTSEIDSVSLSEMLRLINEEDKVVAINVGEILADIESTTAKVVESLASGGRLIYIGAGTSGRLGVLDAAECPPTFGTSPNLVQGLIAGGPDAMFVAKEGAEDSTTLPITDLKAINLTNGDVLVGLAASGRTPYVLAGIDYAKSIGCYTALICTVPKSQAIANGAAPHSIIACEVGPEAITGSTRMKSGTAQKLILNMISTAAMVSLGKTLGNVMVDLKPSNAKLIERSKKTIIELTGIGYQEATSLLAESGNHVKTALVMHFAQTTPQKAAVAIKNADGRTRKAIEILLNGASAI